MSAVTEYRKVMVRGRPRYLGPPTGKFIKAENIPPDVMIRLENEDKVPTIALAVSKECIFCGVGDCRLTRAINSQTIYLCGEHYYDKTIGKVAQRLKELQEK